MNKAALQKAVSAYKSYLEDKQNAEAIRKISFYLQGNRKYFTGFSKSDFYALDREGLFYYISKLYSKSGITARGIFLANRGPANVKNGIAGLIYGTGPIEKRYASGMGVKSLSQYSVSELMMYLYPHSYGLWPSDHNAAFLFMDEAEKNEIESYKDAYQAYKLYCDFLMRLRKELEKQGLAFKNMIDLAVFQIALGKIWANSETDKNKKKSKDNPPKAEEVKREEGEAPKGEAEAQTAEKETPKKAKEDPFVCGNKAIAKAIASAINGGYWLSLEYENYKGEITYAWYAIKDVDGKTGKIKADTFNSSYSMDGIENVSLRFDKIRSAARLPFTSYDVPNELIEKIEANPKDFEWLKLSDYSIAILDYLEECNIYDQDPCQNNSHMVPKVDLGALVGQGSISLDDEQFREVVKLVNDVRFEEKRNSGVTFSLALSILSIDDEDKKYVVAYLPVTFNPMKKELKTNKEAHFNGSFVTDPQYKKSRSLSDFYSGSMEDFKARFISEKEELINELKETIHDSPVYWSNLVNTRPDLMILERENLARVEQACQIIEQRQEEGKLTPAIKAFFGDTRNFTRRIAKPRIITFDDKVDIKQLSAIYNIMSRPVTYVQGPPGTGKTKTIFNLLTSCFVAWQTVLVTSYNNKPVNDLSRMLDSMGNYEGKKIIFPYLRLGNFELMAEAAKKLRYYFEIQIDERKHRSELEAFSDEIFEKNSRLAELLDEYEKKYMAEEKVSQLRSFARSLSKSKNLQKGLESRLEEFQKAADSLRKVSNEEIKSQIYIAKEDPRCMELLYHLSNYRLGLLKLERFDELRRIAYIDEDEIRAKEFTAFLADDENLRLLTTAFPIIFSTNISSAKLGSGAFIFDLLVMDEAGQCDMARSLIPMVRANKLLLTGDPMQLSPVVCIDPDVHERLKNKYQIDDRFDYVNNSIIVHHDKVDKASRKILLSYHYRCGRKIIDFSNRMFYHDELDLSHLMENGEVNLFSLTNNAENSKYNACVEEAHHIVKYVIERGWDDPRKAQGEVKILTPFVKQRDLINTILKGEGIRSVEASTIHAMQGAEANIVIFSTAISSKTRERTYNWLKNNKEIINVGVSRAKKELYVFADPAQIERLSKATKDEKQPYDALSALVKYAASQGDVHCLPLTSGYASFEKSNLSKAEDDFYKTLSQVLTFDSKLALERNISVADTFPRDPEAKIHFRRSYDSVLFSVSGNGGKTPLIAFEVAGGEHVFAKNNDVTKARLADKNHCLYMMVGNNDVRDYEMMKKIVTAVFSGKKETHTQLDLLDSLMSEDEESQQ